MKKAEIDREGCIGCGLCASLCPEVFRMAEDDLAEVYGAVTPDNSEQVTDAAASCPVAVISIR